MPVSDDGRIAVVRFEVRDTGIGIAPADQRPHVRTVFAGRRLDDPPLRWYRSRPRNRRPTRRADGRPARSRQRSRPGQHVLVRTALRTRRLGRCRRATPLPRSSHRCARSSSTTTRRIASSCASSSDRGASIPTKPKTRRARSNSSAPPRRDGEAYDLAILDLNMPGMDGLELARDIKADPATAGAKLFLLSSSGRVADDVAAEAELERHDDQAGASIRAVRLHHRRAPHAGDSDEPRRCSSDRRTDRVRRAGRARRCRLLLVEDNNMNQLVATRMLAKLGYARRRRQQRS